MEIIKYGEIILKMENGETITITGKDAIELIRLSIATTNFLKDNSIGKQETVLNIWKGGIMYV